MTGKSFWCAAVAAALLWSASVAMAMTPLTAEQISEAQTKANRLIPDPTIVFAYRSMASAGPVTGGHFIVGDVRTAADIYWITPFPRVINEQVEQTRSGRRDFGAFHWAGDSCQLRILFNIRNFDRERFLNAVIRVTQGERVLEPSRIRYANLQRSIEPDIGRRTTWQRVGVVLDFPAMDVAPDIPITVTVRGDGDTPLVFPPLQNDGKYDRYGTKRHAFLWYPLHDTL
ncbi:MAG: hypothetical protein ACTTJE_02520 [Schwartzia sp. (in: firmicutes)]